MAVRVALKVVPGSTREGMAGWLGDLLKVRVRAPAEAGRANEAILRVVAAALDLPLQSVRIASGT